MIKVSILVQVEEMQAGGKIIRTGRGFEFLPIVQSKIAFLRLFKMCLDATMNELQQNVRRHAPWLGELW